MKITQKDRIINYIRQFGSITSWEAYQDLVLSEKEHLKESYLEQALWRIVDSIEWSERVWDKLQWVKMFMDVMWMVNKEAIIIEKKSLPTIEYKKWNKSLWL